ncbi:ywrD [Scenedesmus sp. PABB004]|nr:ywrD [Scenedesmus sp. PABB004]
MQQEQQQAISLAAAAGRRRCCRAHARGSGTLAAAAQSGGWGSPMAYNALLEQAAGGAALPFTSRRSPVYGTRGMVSASQPLAAEAGLRVLQAGGNAADAAVAVGAALGVTEPCSTGLGGDAFALFYRAADRRVLCLQGSGAAPAGLSLAAVRAAGVAGPELPHRSPLCVSVPGAAALWDDALAAWGSGAVSLRDALAPAVELAERGFPVSPLTAHDWCRGAAVVADAGGPGARALVDAAGRGPAPGQLWRNPDLAATYRRLGEHGAARGFYSGPVADAIVAALAGRGGVMAAEDLAAHRTIETEPACCSYMGHTVWQVPPPTAGVVALMALNIMEAHRAAAAGAGRADGQQAAPPRLNLGEPRPGAAWSAEQVHLGVEALRLSFADALAWVCDPHAHELPLQICAPEPCEEVPRGVPKRVKGGDTCQWVAAREAARGGAAGAQVVDGQGNAASFIQSNYMGFGTGIVPEGTGFSLQNRCHGFNLEPAHPNSLAPGKRPYHTIMPGLLTGPGGELAAAYGCMGAYMQPQGHVQLLASLLELGLDPQDALDAPRFCIDGLDSAIGPASVLGGALLLEDGFAAHVRDALAARGHAVRVRAGRARSVFGKGAIIVRDAATGVLAGGADPRGDGSRPGAGGGMLLAAAASAAWRQAPRAAAAASLRAARGAASSAAATERPLALDAHGTIGFIGVGNLGAPSAANLLRAGLPVLVYDRDAAAVARLTALGARAAASPQEIAETPGVTAVVSMLPSTEHVEAVYDGPDGLLSARGGLQPALLIDCSTILPTFTAALAARVAAAPLAPGARRAGAGGGAVLVDAPASGGVPGAVAGTLSFMCGGTEEAVRAATPILQAMGKRVQRLGPPGAGQAAKICNNLAMAIQMAGVAEALALGAALGLDPARLSAVFNASSARCWSSECYNPAPGVMADVPAARGYANGFSAALMAKDLRLALSLAATAPSRPQPLHMGERASQLYSAVVEASPVPVDFSAVYTVVYGGTPAGAPPSTGGAAAPLRRRAAAAAATPERRDTPSNLSAPQAAQSVKQALHAQADHGARDLMDADDARMAEAAELPEPAWAGSPRGSGTGSSSTMRVFRRRQPLPAAAAPPPPPPPPAFHRRHAFKPLVLKRKAERGGDLMFPYRPPQAKDAAATPSHSGGAAAPECEHSTGGAAAAAGPRPVAPQDDGWVRGLLARLSSQQLQQPPPSPQHSARSGQSHLSQHCEALLVSRDSSFEVVQPLRSLAAAPAPARSAPPPELLAALAALPAPAPAASAPAVPPAPAAPRLDVGGVLHALAQLAAERAGESSPLAAGQVASELLGPLAALAAALDAAEAGAAQQLVRGLQQLVHRAASGELRADGPPDADAAAAARAEAALAAAEAAVRAELAAAQREVAVLAATGGWASLLSPLQRLQVLQQQQLLLRRQRQAAAAPRAAPAGGQRGGPTHAELLAAWRALGLPA